MILTFTCLKDIIYPTSQSESLLFESDRRPPNENIKGGTLLSKTTFVFYTDATNNFRQRRASINYNFDLIKGEAIYKHKL